MRKIAASLVYAFVGLPALLAALFLSGASPRLLDRATWERAVADERPWAAARSVDLSALADADGSTAGPVLLGEYRLDRDALSKAVREDLPWDGLRGWTVQATKDVFDALEGKALDPRLDLRPLEALLAGSADEIAGTYVAALPERPAGAASDPGDLATIPAGANRALVAKTATEAIRKAVAAIPDTAPLSGPDMPVGGLVAARAALGSATTFSLLGAGALWLGLGFAASGLWSRRMRFLGVTMAVPAGIVLVSGLILRLPFEAGVAALARDPAFAAVLGGSAGAGLVAWARELLALVSNGWLASGGIAAAVAAGLLGARRSLEAAEDAEER